MQALANQNANQLVQQVVLQQQHTQQMPVTVTSTGMNIQPIQQHSQQMKQQHVISSQGNQLIDRNNQMSVVSIASSINNTALVTSASNVVSLSILC